MKKRKYDGASDFERYSGKDGAMFVYPHRNDGIMRLCDTGRYGVVQLVCVQNAVRAAFMAGHRAGKRSVSRSEKA